MKFEKWTALGNDYLIVEAAALPWELNEERIKRICNRPFGVGSDGILLLLPHEDPAYVAELRSILVAVGASDGKMEEGSLRVDCNVSVRRRGEPNAPGTRAQAGARARLRAAAGSRYSDG